jgi:hypothetical protein
MSEDDRLLPPEQVIHERLTRNQRERRLLRTLLRLIVDKDRDQATPDRPKTAAGPEGGR